MRLIDADALKKHYSWWNDGYKKIFDNIIDQQPTIEERKKGKWKVAHLPKGEMKYCSECGFGQYVADERRYDFCPNCGADMREET